MKKINDRDEITFSRMLEHKAVDRGIKKTERTRYLILSRLVARIEEMPTAKITVEMILSDTGLSRGTFYNYFKDVNECVYFLLTLFLETWDVRSGAHRRKDLFGAIFDTNLYYCLRYEKNAALFAAFFYYSASLPELEALRNKINSQWVNRIVSNLEIRVQVVFDDKELHRLEGAIKMLIAMTTETLKERYINNDEQLANAFSNSEELTYALSLQWYPVLANPKQFVQRLNLPSEYQGSDIKGLKR